MKRFTPLYGILVVLLFVGAIVSANFAISGGFGVIQDARQAARLRLWGQNTYTGETVVRLGWLSVRGPAGLGDPATGTTVEPDGVLIMETSVNTTMDMEPVTLIDGGAIYIRPSDWAGPVTLSGTGRITPWFDDQEATVSGLLTGDGAFVRMSAQSRFTNDDAKESILTVTNASNDYAGGTVIQGGVLRIFDDGALGAPGTPVTFQPFGFNEGSSALATAADSTIARDILLPTPGWLRADAGTTGTYSGVISGVGSLSIGFLDWTGAVALEGDNTFAGGAVVRAGTLLAMNSTGSATGSGDVLVDPGAAIGGVGAVAGDVVLTGSTIAPGASAGALSVGGLSMDDDSTMAVQIAGSDDGQFDRVVSTGPVTLAGALDVSLLDGYELQADDAFEIVSAPSVSGAFAVENLPPNLEVDQQATSVTLRAVGLTPPCPADLTGDGVVDGADLGLLLGAWGACDGDCPADLNADGVIDGADLGTLLGAWG